MFSMNFPCLNDMNQLLVGVLVCLVGATATNVGVVLQKLSHLRNDRLSPSKQSP